MKINDARHKSHGFRLLGIKNWDKTQIWISIPLTGLIISLLLVAATSQLVKIIQFSSKPILAQSSEINLQKTDSNINLNKLPESSSDNNQVTSKSQRAKIPILIYHYIGDNPDPKDIARDSLSVSPANFEKQMDFLNQNGNTTISIETLLQFRINPTILPQKPVILTFDDGYIDFYYNAFPILEKYSFSATVFLPVGLVGKPSYLKWEMIEIMHKTGRIKFESHGVDHLDLTSLDLDKLIFELTAGKKTIEEKLQTQVKTLAYPYGRSNQQVKNMAKIYGYQAGFSTVNSSFNLDLDFFSIPRLRSKNSSSLTDFAELVENK